MSPTGDAKFRKVCRICPFAESRPADPGHDRLILQSTCHNGAAVRRARFEKHTVLSKGRHVPASASNWSLSVSAGGGAWLGFVAK